MPEGYGPFTHIGIRELPPLFPEHGTPQAVLPRGAESLALELAATEYSFEPQAWRRAGWADIVFYPSAGQGSLLGHAEALLDRGRKFLDGLPGWGRVKSLIHIPGSAGRADEPDGDPEDERAVLLTRPLHDGRYMVAAAFRGTGGRMTDWAPNINCAPDDGFHSGFLGLARAFEKNADRIQFPKTAAELGLERLTLEDIINEARREGSRFVIFATGHSQGGAVLQLWFHHLMMEGVLPANLLGCGFASPSVAYGSRDAGLEYPIAHIVNSDDVTPRVGAERHLGRVLAYTADTALRGACYAGNWDDAGYRGVVRSLHAVRGTRDAMISVIAFLQAVAGLPEKDASAVLYGTLGFLESDIAMKSAAEHALVSVRLMLRLLGRNYRLVTGGPPDESLLQGIREGYAAELMAIGPERYAALFRDALAYPHILVREPGAGMGSYHYIVMNSSRLKEVTEQPQSL